MSNLFKKHKSSRSKKRRAFSNFENKCYKEKSINLNPLLAIIINLVPMFLIVLNMRAIVGFEQTNMPEATYVNSRNVDSKTTFNVDLSLYNNTTKVVVRNYKGAAVTTKTFKNIKHSKDQVAKFISGTKKNMGHLNILTPDSKVKFDDIGQAIDLGSFKKEGSDKKLFTNFSIGNIL